MRADSGTPPSSGTGRSADRALVEQAVAAVRGADPAAAEAARSALDAKTKPRGSLGRLEELACRISAIHGSVPTSNLPPAVVVCAADHGIAAEGVSAYPQEVTGQMLRNFAAGGAAVCVLARQAAARLLVVDLGVRTEVPCSEVLDRRVRAGTANAAHGPAMSQAEADRALAVGVELADELAGDGVGLVALGEMGIGNSTAASALTAVLLRADPAGVCGRGTGIDDGGLERKIAAVWRALEANEVSPRDPLGAIAAVGGLEIAALAGLVIGCAARRIPVLVDGFITAAAALAAVCTAPRCADALIASHLSPEPGHRMILRALDLEPLLNLEMRLGEGSGAALALPVVASALAILAEMETFDAAGVTNSGA